MRCAWLGLRYGLFAEASLRMQALALGLVVAVLLWLRPGAIWWALALLASSAVLAAELLNTAIERLADVLHPAQSDSIRIVKDCAAAAVLIAALGALAVAAAFIVHLLRTYGARLYDF
jgi:undecaprenol kinase